MDKLSKALLVLGITASVALIGGKPYMDRRDKLAYNLYWETCEFKEQKHDLVSKCYAWGNEDVNSQDFRKTLRSATEFVYGENSILTGSELEEADIKNKFYFFFLKDKAMELDSQIKQFYTKENIKKIISTGIEDLLESATKTESGEEESIRDTALEKIRIAKEFLEEIKRAGFNKNHHTARKILKNPDYYVGKLSFGKALQGIVKENDRNAVYELARAKYFLSKVKQEEYNIKEYTDSKKMLDEITDEVIAKAFFAEGMGEYNEGWLGSAQLTFYLASTLGHETAKTFLERIPKEVEEGKENKNNFLYKQEFLKYFTVEEHFTVKPVCINKHLILASESNKEQKSEEK